MPDSVEVAIGVVEGRVVARWPDPATEIVFDAKNAYSVGRALVLAAAEAYDGDLEQAVRQDGTTPTDAKRLLLVNMVSTMLKTYVQQGKSPGYMALHAVDMVLSEVVR